MAIYTVFFGRLAGLESKTGGIPYPIFVFAGLLPWTFFAASITRSSESLVASTNLITKVYFPRLIIPAASVCAALVDLAVSFLALFVLMLLFRIGLTWQLALAPLFVIATILTAVGVGSLLSALTVAYRDFRYTLPFMVQTWMFLSPVIYPKEIVPERWAWLLYLNPMTGLINGFRSSFLGAPMDWLGVAISLAIAGALACFGVSYFRSVERRFADII